MQFTTRRKRMQNGRRDPVLRLGHDRSSEEYCKTIHHGPFNSVDGIYSADALHRSVKAVKGELEFGPGGVEVPLAATGGDVVYTPGAGNGHPAAQHFDAQVFVAVHYTAVGLLDGRGGDCCNERQQRQGDEDSTKEMPNTSNGALFQAERIGEAHRGAGFENRDQGDA